MPALGAILILKDERSQEPFKAVAYIVWPKEGRLKKASCRAWKVPKKESWKALMKVPQKGQLENVESP